MSRFTEGSPSGQSQERGEKSEFLEVTAEFLAEIVSSKKFLMAVQQALLMTARTQNEAGFSVGVIYSKKAKLLWGKAVGSQSLRALNEISFGGAAEESLGKGTTEIIDEEIAALFSLHTHPSENSLPSEDDFISQFYHRIMIQDMVTDFYPVHGIVSRVPGTGQVDILLIQETRHPINDSFQDKANQIYGQLLHASHGKYEKGDPSYDQALEWFKQVHYVQVALVSFRLSGKNLEPIQSKEEVAALLKNFSFQPKKVE